jgi:hypothetical protein
MTEIEPRQPSGITRRRVTQGVAWAVPVIAIAAPVPAFAGVSQGILTLTGVGCKLPGASNPTYKGYAFKLIATNTTANKYYCVTIGVVTLNGDDLGQSTVINLATGQCSNLGNPFCVPPGGLPNLAIVTADAGSSSNGQLIVNYTVRENTGSCDCAGGTVVPTTPASTGINDAPPINGESCGPDKFTAAEKLCLASLALG